MKQPNESWDDYADRLGSFQGFRFTETPDPATWRRKFWQRWLDDIDEEERRLKAEATKPPHPSPDFRRWAQQAADRITNA